MAAASTVEDTMKVRVLLVLVIVAIMFTGCLDGQGVLTYETSSGTEGTLLTDRATGKVYRVFDSSVVELPRVELDNYSPGRTVRTNRDIASNDFTVTVDVKLMNTFLMWKVEIEPSTAATAAAANRTFDQKLNRLKELQRQNWTTVTVDLRDEDGFLVRPIEVLLSRNATQMIRDADVHYGFMYEGTLDAGFETLQQIRLVDVRWRL